MYILKKMITTLQSKPVIGILAGFGSAVFAAARDFFTDGAVLNIVTACGIWFGAIVSVLAIIAQVMKIREIRRRNRK